ncbi:MAG: hypothetical protein R3F65_32530, partial [bacterium]
MHALLRAENRGGAVLGAYSTSTAPRLARALADALAAPAPEGEIARPRPRVVLVVQQDPVARQTGRSPARASAEAVAAELATAAELFEVACPGDRGDRYDAADWLRDDLDGLAAALASPTPFAPEVAAPADDPRVVATSIFGRAADAEATPGISIQTAAAPAARPGRARHPETSRLPTSILVRAARVLDGADLADGRYLRRDALAPVEDAPVIALVAPCGAGKTEALRPHLQRLEARLGRPPVVLVLTHRRGLAGTSVPRLELLGTHMNSRGEVEIRAEVITRMAAVTDSAAAVLAAMRAAGITRIDALIIDESEAVVRQLRTAARQPSELAAIFSAVRELSRMADQTIIADATMSALSIEVLADLKGLTIDEMLSRTAIVHDRRMRSQLSPLRVVALETRADAILAAKALVAAGIAPHVAMGSKAAAKALAAELRDAHPELLFPLITGDHDDELGAAVLADPNAWIMKHRGSIGAVIYTPAVESGMSIEEPLNAGVPDHVVAIAEGHQTIQQVIQQASRARGAAVWHLYAPESGPSRYLDEEDLTRGMIEGQEDTHGLTKPAGGWEAGPRVPIDPELMRTDVRVRVHIDRSRVALRADLHAWLEAEGYRIEVPEVSPDDGRRREVGRALAERGEQLAEAEIAEILAADDSELSVGEAERILETGVDLERRPAARRRIIRDFYGDADEREVRWDAGRSARRQIAAFVAAEHLIRDGGVDLIEADRAADPRTALRGRARAAIVTHTVIEAFGVTPEMILGEARGEAYTGKQFSGEGIELDLSPARMAALWRRCCVRSTRDAIRLELGVDPWRQIPKAGREETIAALNAWNDGLTGVVSGKEGPTSVRPSTEPPALPERHTLARLLTAALARLGLRAASVVSWDEGSVRRRIFDLTRAREVRALARAHYERMHPASPPEVTEADIDALISAQTEQMRVLDRERVWGRATQGEVDALRRAQDRAVWAAVAAAGATRARRARASHQIAGAVEAAAADV